MNLQRAHVAQWIRHRPPKPRIVGSSPTVGKLFSLSFTNQVVVNMLFTSRRAIAMSKLIQINGPPEGSA